MKSTLTIEQRLDAWFLPKATRVNRIADRTFQKLMGALIICVGCFMLVLFMSVITGSIVAGLGFSAMCLALGLAAEANPANPPRNRL